MMSLIVWISLALASPHDALGPEVDKLLALGQVDLAAERCVLALRDQERVLGPMHPEVGRTLQIMARVQRARGKPEVAERMEARAREIAEAVREDPSLDKPVPPADSNQDLAGVAPMVARAAQLREEGNLPAAQALLERALQQQQDSIGPRHPQVVNTLKWLAIVLEEQGKSDLAEAFRRRAAAVPAK